MTPEKIHNQLSEAHKRVEGTSIYFEYPDAYEQLESFPRIQKHEKCYIHVAEISGSSFFEAQERLTKKSLESTGAIVTIHENLELNGYQAVYSEGPSKFPGETKLGFFFGDSSFSAIVMAVYRNDSIQDRNELRTILQSLVRSDTVQIAEGESTKFGFDTSITIFQRCQSISNLTSFALDCQDTSSTTTFTVSSMPSMNLESALSHLNYTLNRIPVSSKISKRPLAFKKLTEETTLFNGYPCALITGEITQSDLEKNSLVGAILIGFEGSSMFIGIAPESDSVTIKRYYETLHSFEELY